MLFWAMQSKYHTLTKILDWVVMGPLSQAESRFNKRPSPLFQLTSIRQRVPNHQHHETTVDSDPNFKLCDACGNDLIFDISAPPPIEALVPLESGALVSSSAAHADNLEATSCVTSQVMASGHDVEGPWKRGCAPDAPPSPSAQLAALSYDDVDFASIFEDFKYADPQIPESMLSGSNKGIWCDCGLKFVCGPLGSKCFNQMWASHYADCLKHQKKQALLETPPTF